VPFFLAGSAALVEGRGERVTPVRGILGEPPGVLLIAPPVPAPTASVFAAFDAGGEAAAPSRGSTRLASEHLAAELARGLRAADLVARAGVLASANDLAAAAATVVPEITALRRALMRRLGRPVGLSGSGPTLWALYPSLAAAEAAASELRDPRNDPAITTPSGPPRIIATALSDGTNGRDAP
jgi:4-diphosphocytidyl-2-C-methyl-D-erythritol kinase